MRLMDYAEERIKEGGRKGPFSEKTIKSYREVWSRHDRFLDGRGINDPIEADMINLCDSVATKNNNNKSAHTTATYLNQMYAWLEAKGLYQNIIKRVLKRYPYDKSRRSILPDDHGVERIIKYNQNALNQNERRRGLFAWLLLHELGNLEISRIKISDCLNHSPVKRIRTINRLYPISDDLSSAMKSYIEEFPTGCEYIFTDLSNRSRNKGKPIGDSFVSTQVLKLLQELGIHIPHKLTAMSLQAWGRENKVIGIH